MSDELRDEYQFDYSKAKPNRFAFGPQNGNGDVVPDSNLFLVLPC